MATLDFAKNDDFISDAKYIHSSKEYCEKFAIALKDSFGYGPSRKQAYTQIEKFFADFGTRYKGQKTVSNEIIDYFIKEIPKQKIYKLYAPLLAWLCYYHSKTAKELYDDIELAKRVKMEYRKYIGKPGDRAKFRNGEAIDKSVEGPPELEASQWQGRSHSGLADDDGRIALRRQSFENHISELLQDYEHHDLEDQFKIDIKDGSVRNFLLVGGPGVGKSALLASLASEHANHYNCIAHFFREKFDRDDEANAASFYLYVLAQLRAIFPELSAMTELQGEDGFSVALLHLSRHNKITANKPFFLFVDALDEMTMGESSVNSPSNPLRLPTELPPGVFIVQSTRHDPLFDSQARTIQGQKIYNLNSGKQKDQHEATVRRYIRRFCTDPDDLSLIQNFAKEGDVNRAINKIAEDAKYNFMLIRGILNDKEYLAKRNSVPRTLTEYYQDQLARMRAKSNDQINYLAPYAFTFSREISTVNFLRLLYGEDSPEGWQFANKQVRLWIAQGLIIRVETTRKNEWIGVYHRTYREFLATMMSKEDSARTLQPFAKNLLRFWKSDGPNNQLKLNGIFVQLEWARLILDIAKQAEMVGVLRELLEDLDFWLLASAEKDGFNDVIKGINKPPKGAEDPTAFYLLYRDLSGSFCSWLKEKKLVDRAAKPYSIAKFYEAGAAVAKSDRQPSSNIDGETTFVDEVTRRLRRH